MKLNEMPNKRSLEIEILAEKLLNKTITPQEFKKLEEWYAEVPETSPVWNLADESKSALESRMLTSIRQRIQKPHKSIRLWKSISVAASVLLAFGLGFWFWPTLNKTQKIVQVVETSTAGKITKIYLPDHSIVWLKGNSRLDYPSQFSDTTRNVTLHGEALFEVAKDRMHPFIITTSKYVTKVLGTSFNINENAAQNTFKLTVLTGKVSISKSVKRNEVPSKPFIVTPGNEFEVLDAKAAPQVIVAQQSSKAMILHGTEYDMNFENTSFAEIRKRIEKKFNVVILADQSLYGNCNLSADVTDQSLENTMKVISSVLNLKHYAINKNEITLTGGGCN